MQLQQVVQKTEAKVLIPHIKLLRLSWKRLTRKKGAYAEAILNYTECIRKVRFCPTEYEVLKVRWFFLFYLQSLWLDPVSTKAWES